MKPRKIKENISLLGAIDWDRRVFDALVPIPDGTSYNSYFIQGSEKTVLIDTVEPTMSKILMKQLDSLPEVDYVISLHAEQDHSGSLECVLDRYPKARLITNKKCKNMLIELLNLPEDRIDIIKDGDTLSLGDKTLKFIFTPWVHWPETMSAYLEEDKILFSCDFFGAHLATTDTFVTEEAIVYESAKRYYAEIMMPFRKHIIKNLVKLDNYDIEMIAPSHGPVYPKAEFILDAYKSWVSDKPKNKVLLTYITMHESTKMMVDYLVEILTDRGVSVEKLNLGVTDIGKVIISLVDAATIIFATPTVLGGPHPDVLYAAYMTNALKPKAKYYSIIGSFGWNGKPIKLLDNILADLDAKPLDSVLSRGVPKEEVYKELELLADTIAEKHSLL